MDLFDAAEIGSARAIGTKHGNVAGSSVDVIYPSARLIDNDFLPGRTLSWEWKADKHRWFHPRNTRLAVTYEMQFGEVPGTVSDATKGVEDQATSSRPATHIRMAALPNASLFNSQVRFTANGVSLEQTNDFWTTSCATLATSTSLEATNTSGSGMLTSLRKDPGISFNNDYEGVDGDAANHTAPSAAPYIQDTSTGTTVYKTVSGATKLEDLAYSYGVPRLQVLVAADAAAAATTFKVSGPDMEKIDEGDSLYKEDGTTFLGTVETKVADGTISIAAPGLADAITASDKLVVGTADKHPVEGLTLDNLAKALDVRVKPTACKSTTSNPKFMAVQQGWNNGTKTCTVQSSEPLVGLSSWAHGYAMPPGTYGLHATISPNYLKDCIFDALGEYTCVPGGGGALNQVPTTFKARQVYIRIKDVHLEIAYVQPAAGGDGYIPRSMSQKYNPIAVTHEILSSSTVNMSVNVPPSTRAVILCLRNRFNHVCCDSEEISLGGAGISTYGTAAATGGFTYFNKGYNCIRVRGADRPG